MLILSHCEYRISREVFIFIKLMILAYRKRGALTANGAGIILFTVVSFA